MMNKLQILEILNDWNFWKKDLDEGFIREEYLSKLKSLVGLKEIVVLSGVRRAGKSTLLLQFCKELIKKGLRKEEILIVNFEDPRFINLNLDLLNQIYEIYLTELNPSKKQYVILDEVQIVDGWEKFARFLHENKKVQVFVTGSSSKLLDSEYSSVLTGRHVDLEVFPLSFSEFLKFNGVNIQSKLDISEERHKIRKALSEYSLWGGFPKIVLTKSEENKRELLGTYFRDILVKDIVKRFKIKEPDKLENLAKYYLNNVSTLQSFNKVKNFLKLNLDTVERFSHYLSEAHLLFFKRKFSFSEKEQLVNPRKVYSIDSGMRNSVSFVFSNDFGRLAENLVFLELNKRFKEVYYWKNEKQREVDFVVKEKLRVKSAIQVCWNIENEETKQREKFSLIEAMKELKLAEGIVITEDYSSEEKFENKIIKYIPLWIWLLEK